MGIRRNLRGHVSPSSRWLMSDAILKGRKLGGLTKRPGTPLIVKMALVMAGLVLGLVLAEVTLMVSGKIWLLWHRLEQKKIVHQDTFREHEKGVYHIVCAGDSSTFGLGARSELNYASQLMKLLNRYAPGQFSLYLLTTPGVNSTQLTRNPEDPSC